MLAAAAWVSAAEALAVVPTGEEEGGHGRHRRAEDAHRAGEAAGEDDEATDDEDTRV